MFEKDKIAIDLGSSNIKIMVGNKKQVKLFEVIKTPKGCIEDDKIVDLEQIMNLLQIFLKKNNVRTKQIGFVIHGQDVISRHTEVPIIDDKGIKTSLEWEMNQYLPKDIIEYSIDYEIIEKIDTLEKKSLKLLVSAVPKEKIDQLVKLSQMLNLEIVAIDINSNCARRVFKDVSKKHTSLESIAVINLGSNNTNVIILDKGKLFIEREIPFGVNNMLKEIIKKENIEHDSAFEYLKEKFSFMGNENDNELQNRVTSLFNNVLSSLEKIITFFTIGKSKSNLDSIYLIGGGCDINGLCEYVSNYFNCPVYLLDDVKGIGVKTMISTDCNIKHFIGTLGLLLRRE
ncbi:type IV pilus assembly protein PilM [Clostridium lacusfryxellense]|uniref:type IV pilus assembly protein PilM n=1 Tax=Clostridium lacusfryxellense TaxID=205328 RepID=UPI001C0BD70F|nr:type IV pilus assembly protein PilM [Clostridium lacusfryxellense]MBU3110248.1 type IV pilus assembly protein PilM [Clostridium lacusfryxellense]